MIWCESLTQRTNMSRVSPPFLLVLSLPQEHAEMGATNHLVASSEIFLVRWNKHLFNFGALYA